MHGGGGGRYHLRPQLRQNSSLPFDHNLNNNPFLQNHNLPFNSYPQNPNFAAFNPYSQHLNSPLPQRPFTQSRHAFPPAKRDEGLIQRIEQALAKAQRDLLAAGDSVSAWKVSQSALLALQVDSWSSLGFQFQDIPSLYRLILAEGKVNAFIHCFVGVRRITSVYDLEVAICKNEGIEQFEQLGMGPLLRHPLIEHYFSVPSYATDIVKITSEEIIACLADFMDTCGDKEIRAEAFLDSLAKKWAVSGKERLGVRIQSLGLHITSIKEARQAENDALKRYLQGIKPMLDKQTRQDGMQPLTQYDILSEKKKLDRRFDAISERFKSFSSGHESFRGKHIRFVSSSSEDESEDENSNIANSGGQNRSSSHNISTTSQRASSCPYPSAAEEMIRLGLAAELDNHGSPVRGSLNCNENEKSLGKKRKCEKQSEKDSSLHKHPKRDSVAKKDELLPQVLKSKKRHENSKDKAHDLQCPPPSAKGLHVYEKSGKKLQEFGIEMSKKHQSHCQGSEHDDLEMTGELLLTTDAMEKLVTTWKETCREYPVPEVFRRMVDFYNITGRRRKKMKEFFSTYPGIGLLNVAVNSIKRGMWDSLYDTLETIGESGFVGPASTQYTEMIDIGPSPRQDAVQNSKVHISKLQSSVTVEDIIEKIASFFELEPTVGSLILQKHSISFRRFHECEASIMQQFSVKRFGDLGHGDFLEFMDKHICLPPHELCEDLNAKVMVSMLEGQLLLLVSQAAGELLDNVVITKQQIHDLLIKQFPLVSLQVAINAQEDCSDLIKNQKIKYTSSCVFFSSALLGGCTIGDTSVCKVKNALEISETLLINSGALGAVSRKDALGCLLKAPMLSDLLSWSHWDVVFAPSLGPLLEWLLNEVHTKELLCVATRDGKLIRIDHSVTVDNFLEALLQRSAFQTALKLLSLLVLYGGAHLVPMSLLKCYAHRGIEVIMENSLSSGSVKNNSRSLMHERQIIFGKVSTGNSSLVEPSDDAAGIREKNDPVEYLSHMNKAVSVAAKFILDCLVYLPSDFRSFAAGILLAGLRDFTKDAPAFILRECIQNDQRFMLHEIGISLGILEWIEDYRGFISARDTKLYESAEATSKTCEIPSPAIGSIAEHASLTTACFSSEDGTESIVLLDGECEEFTKISEDEALKQVTREKSCCCGGSDLDLSEVVKEKDAALIIESIRRDEFGLDPNLMLSESNLLKKQHARLGRALHCLSQELYSQDSHFLLELVQNADDNFYPENVEPTLVFILRATGIVVLNNERGFLAKNIRALCDVGNSTKKGSGAGYIGQKGIGFKSVFRVTNAPEIHSNGFHVKFDASEGQIGFVLPTLVPPCDINLFVGHISGEGEPIDKSSWNTCIVLPFREKLQEGTGMSSIMSMFSDLHPSLLLFLHRLHCIKFRNMFNNSLVVMRRESVGDGIIKVSHGKEKMSWLIASQKLQASSIRPDVKSTEISVAFTLQESNDGEYRPHLEQQPVFAFLPLRTYGLKFILQGDFVLPSSREEVDGDSAWNQWLLSEFPALFVDAEKSFCGLSCFQESPGRAVTAYMSFVPLVGEVHGFFSHLPHMIISKLRMSNCLLLDGKNEDWVPPCRVIRGWDEQGRALLPEILLHRHLGLGYLHKDIILPDPLAMALGVQEYGPKILADIMSSICSIENGIESLGLDWLSNWFCVLYATLSVNPLRRHTQNPGTECDVLKDLNKISFIPLSDGSYGSLIDGPIWLPCDAFGSGLEGEQSPKDFPNLYAKLRMVNPVLLSIDNANTSSKEDAKVSTLVRMLYKIGVQRLSPHEVIKGHILPALANNTFVIDDKYLMAEYLSFAMHHLQSTCPSCHIERMEIVSELQQKAVVLTNSGYKHPFKDSIHFSKEFGNPVDITRLLGGEDAEWHELDSIYLKHPSIPSLSGGLTKWREFFQVIGVTDFVQVIHVDNEGTDVSHAFSKNMISNGDVNSGGMVVDDWVSPELVQLLTVVSMKGNREKCKYLLEVLDKLWDDHFSEKVTMYCVLRFTEGRKPFGSSFMNSIHNFKWVASSMDEELHQPKDLFCDCEAVRSVMGDFAPYAIPQVRSEKFLREIGFKMQVNIDDALTLLRYWRTCIPPVCASIAQMSKFYNFIWDGMTSSRVKIMEELKRGPFIFVPFINRSRHEDVVSGIFFSPDEVYWQDPSGCVDQMKELVLHCSLGNESGSHSSKMLADFYPHLHDFFVKECGVSKVPPFHSYLQLLLQLSRIALPSQAAKVVFSVLLKWADDVKSGLVASQGIASLKEGLLKVDTTVLPTVQDRWVSLHSSFGLVCWCDDLELRKQFIHSSNIDFLYFGETSSEEGEMLSAKLVTLMQALGVPALSEAVSREAIFYGTEDCRATASLVNWVLPYAQRYLYKQHSDIYFSLKQLGFANLIQLQVVVVEKLFYKHVIKGCTTASKKRCECSCLVQGNTLYVTKAADSHSVFLELSRLFFKGSADLHLANFLHMVATMAESGSTEEQVEFFIVANQKIPKLPSEEPLWSLACLHVLNKDDGTQPLCDLPMNTENPSKIRRKAGISSNWPPTDWKTAPDFNFARSNGFKTKRGTLENDDSHIKSYNPDDSAYSKDCAVSFEINGDWVIADNATTTTSLGLQEHKDVRNEPQLAMQLVSYDMPEGIALEQFRQPESSILHDQDVGTSTFATRDQLCFGTPNGNQLFITGRLGELVAYKYFSEKLGSTAVRWVNEETETGLPYDMVIGEDGSKEYIEVKATKSWNKDWFMISTREWQFAAEKGDSFSIAHVVLADPKSAKITLFKDPIRLCQQDVLHLAVLMRKQPKESSVT